MELAPRTKEFNFQHILTGHLTVLFAAVVFTLDLINVDFSLWRQISVFALLAFISRLMPTRLPQGADFSVAFIIELILIKLYGTPIAIVVGSVVTLLAGLFSKFLGNKDAVSRTFKNTSQSVLVIALTGWTYGFISNQILAFLMAVMIYFILVVTFISLNGVTTTRTSFIETWISVSRTLFINYFTLSLLTYLLTYLIGRTTIEWKLFSVLMFFVPVMLVSYAFKLSIDIKQSYLNTVKTIARAIEAKDPYMKGHSEHVSELTLAMGRELPIPERELQKLQYVALLHDVGKIGVPEEILNKPGALLPEQFEKVRKHSKLGAEIIKKIKFLSYKSDIVLYHHEKYDGSGYPAGLNGEEIPLESRIIAVADAYNAMITERPFRLAKTPEDAVEEMEHLSGEQFDPNIVKILKVILKRRGEI